MSKIRHKFEKGKEDLCTKNFTFPLAKFYKTNFHLRQDNLYIQKTPFNAHLLHFDNISNINTAQTAMYKLFKCG